MDTESMARRKGCPQPRLDMPLTGGLARCVGADCMAWRWATSPRYQRIYCSDPSATVEPSTRPARVALEGWVFEPLDGLERAHWREPEGAYNARRLGYCGLAGRPGET
jgi:hypothetical protein